MTTTDQSLTLRVALFAANVNYHLLAVAAVTLASLAYFVYLAAPDITWVNVASDAPDYLIGTQFLRIAHPTGEPLYLLLGAAWIRIFPFGTEYWRLALLSAIPMAATAGLLYHHSRNLLAPLVFLASGTVVSQATVAEIYGLTLFLMVLAWHLHGQEKRAWAYVALGLGCAIHHWAALMLIGMAIRDIQLYGWRSLKTSAIAVIVGLPWYLYVPLANRPPYVSIEGNEFNHYLGYFFSQGGLFGGLAVRGLGPLGISADFWERLADFGRVIGGGFGLPALALLGVGVAQSWRRGERAIVLLTLGFAFHYFWNLDPHTHTYTVPAFAFGALLVAGAEPSPQWRWLKGAAALTAVALIAFNLWFYDVQGPLLDRERAARTYYDSLSALPDGAVLWASNRDWEMTTAGLYNWQEGRKINLMTDARPRPTKCGLWTMLQQAEAAGLLYQTFQIDALEHTSYAAPSKALPVYSHMVSVVRPDTFKQGDCATPEVRFNP